MTLDLAYLHRAGNTPQPGRAHLLPLIRSHTTNDSLLFFTTYFRPLSERVFSRKVAAEDSGRASEGKIWEVLVGQVWDCFPGFCEIPRDLKQVSIAIGSNVTMADLPLRACQPNS